MPLKLYDTKEAVPEAQRAAAIETKDGKFAAEEVDPALGEKGERALEAAKQKAKDEKKRADDAEKERDELKRTQAAAASGLSEEKLKEITAPLEKRAAEAETRATEAEAREKKKDATDRLTKLCVKHGIMPDRLEDALLILSGRTENDKDGGLLVKGKDGKVHAEGVENYIEKVFKTEKPYLYAGVNASGSGTDGSEVHGDNGYDPVKAGKEAAAQQKKAATESGLAFK